MSKSFEISYTETYQIKARGLKFSARKPQEPCVGLAQGFSKQTGKSGGRISAKKHTGMGWWSNAYLNMSQLFSTDLLAQKGHGSIKVSDGFLGLREQRLQSERISNRFQYNRMKFFGKWQIKHIIRNQRYWVDSYKLGIQSTNPTYWRTKEDSGLGGNRHGSCIRYHWYHLHFSETQPQSSKASLAPHASKPQSLKAAKPLWRLTLQSLKAWTLGCFGALAALSGFGASWRFSDASKPERLDAVALWRFGAWRLLHALALLDAFPTPQSLKASKPERLDALALWRVSNASKPQSLKAWTIGCFGPFDALALGALALWRFGALALGALDALVPLGPLALCGSLTLWRLALLMLWCLLALWRFAALWRFGASWRFETSRLCDALALCGSFRHAILELGKKVIL